MKRLSLFAGVFSLLFGGPAIAQNLVAAICIPETGEPFFLTIRGQKEKESWFIGTTAVDAVNAADAVRLANLEDNTLLFFGGAANTFHGVLNGNSTSGRCVEVSEEFVDALKAQSPALAEENTRLSEESSRLGSALQKAAFEKSEAEAGLNQCLEGSANARLQELNAVLTIVQNQRDAAVKERDTMEAFIGALRRSSLADGTFSTTGRAWIIQNYASLTKELGRPVHWQDR